MRPFIVLELSMGLFCCIAVLVLLQLVSFFIILIGMTLFFDHHNVNYYHYRQCVSPILLHSSSSFVLLSFLSLILLSRLFSFILFVSCSLFHHAVFFFCYFCLSFSACLVLLYFLSLILLPRRFSFVLSASSSLIFFFNSLHR